MFLPCGQEDYQADEATGDITSGLHDACLEAN